MKKFYSNGKLLLTGEYAVLDGALALAVPTVYGQSLELQTRPQPGLSWTSLDEQGNSWLKADFELREGQLNFRPYSTGSTQDSIVLRLQQILHEAHQLNPEILSENKGYKVTTRLDFPRDWGLGTSSTLVNNIAEWFQADAQELLQRTFGGSGYDIAAAKSDLPVIFQVRNNQRTTLSATFDPVFKEQLFFVYLEKKQNSREAIAHYRKQPKESLQQSVEKISGLTTAICNCNSLAEFELLLQAHETLISKLIGLPKVKNSLFPDYPGQVKSLGGWGGDFVLATGDIKLQDYFRDKGYSTVIPYSKMVK